MGNLDKLKAENKTYYFYPVQSNQTTNENILAVGATNDKILPLTIEACKNNGIK